MEAVRFDGQVAVVTGAGNGLGKEYALLLAARGAKVVVNDLGNSLKGDGDANSRPADLVVAEIRKNGGTAVANYDSVEFGDRVIKTAVDNFGRVDILINNAGIIRERSFGKLSDRDWDLVFKVHLNGTMSCTSAALKVMMQNKYGRIINIGSTSGIFGNFGTSSYGTAKQGIHGLTQSTAAENKKYGIYCNMFVPIAYTRMSTSNPWTEDMIKNLD